MAKKAYNKSNSRKGGYSKKKGNQWRDKDNSQDTRDDAKATGSKYDNDASWYAVSPALLKAAGSLPYAWPLGNEIDVGTAMGDTQFNAAVPGIGVLHWVPTIGIAKDATSPINISAMQTYSWTRHANSGSSNYFAPDQMMYILAMDSLYSYYAMCRRVYGCLNLFSKVNKYYPRAVVTALGFDYDDLTANMADFNYWLNNFAHKLSAFAVPTGMTYFARHVWLNDNIYLDSPDVSKAQMYLFVQDAFYKYNNLGSAGSELNGIPFKSSATELKTFRDIVEFGEDLLEVVFHDEDFGIMSGDIIKAWGKEHLVQLYDTPLDFTVMPQFNGEVLSQIQNACILGSPIYGDTSTAVYEGHGLNITQNNDINAGYIQSDPWFGWEIGRTSKVVGLKHIISINAEDVTPEMNMVATRFTNIATGYETDTGAVFDTQYKYSSLGTEVCTNFELWTYARNDGNDDFELERHILNADLNVADYLASPNAKRNHAKLLNQLSAFHCHPKVWLTDGDVVYSYLYEINNYTTIDAATLAKLHETALLGEFNVPRVGRQ